MAVRCEGCGQGWKTGEPIGRCGCTSDGADLTELLSAAVFATQVLCQRLRLAWSRRRARVQLRKAHGDPYRSIGSIPRFELHVGEDVLESDSFGGIIAQMRALGCSDAEVIEAAIVTHRTPRGGRVRINHMRRVNETLQRLARVSLPGPSPIPRLLDPAASPPAPKPRSVHD